LPAEVEISIEIRRLSNLSARLYAMEHSSEGGTGKDWDVLAREYDETRGGEPFAEYLVGDLIRWLDADGPVLELATGTGLIAQALQARGRRVVGVDLSAEMLAHARARGVNRLVQADGRQLPIRGSSIGTVVAVRLFQLVTDQDPFMAELSRILKSEGRILITPVWDGRDTDAINTYYWNNGRARRAGLGHLTDVASRGGFEVVAFVPSEGRFRMISPNEEADRLARLWHRSTDDHPLRRLPNPDQQVRVRGGYDHLILERRSPSSPRHAQLDR
jgi:SAM-dependent methyltransferase